jgi:hypothetical protein
MKLSFVFFSSFLLWSRQAQNGTRQEGCHHTSSFRTDSQVQIHPFRSTRNTAGVEQPRLQEMAVAAVAAAAAEVR